jgi:hypothetical protein
MTVKQAIKVLKDINRRVEREYGPGSDINLVIQDNEVGLHNGINIQLEEEQVMEGDKFDSFPTRPGQKIIVAKITSSN